MTIDNVDRPTKGLSVEQKRWLAYRLLHTSDGETSRAAGVADSTLERWKKQHIPFINAYDSLFELDADTRLIIRNYLGAATTEAITVIREKLSSPNEKVALRAAELILKTQGLLREVRENINTELTPEQRIALERARRGLENPPQMAALVEGQTPQLDSPHED